MTRPLRILLVEDHVDTQQVMSRLLASFKHDVKSACTVQSALALAGAHRFDLVISDIGLPDGSGEVLMAQLRKQYKIPGIAVSGFADDEMNSGQPSQFAARLIKPITLEQLEKVIRSVIGE